MMKKYVFTGLLFLSVLTGCGDWLDVTPRQEMKEDDVFQTEDGFKSALVGAYIQLADASLYGCNTSFYFLDYLARMWTAAGINSGYQIDRQLPAWNFTDKDVESLVEEIWKAYYTCIVHLNDILDNISGSESLFANNNDQLIKGEALGLRAFLHLELLRIFGPIPSADAGAKPAIPYVKTMTKDPGRLLSKSYDEVISLIIADLDEAEAYLAKCDPLVKFSNKQMNNGLTAYDPNWPSEERPQDSWQYSRQLRFNYFAVKAAKARYYYWIGNTEMAIRYAREVIDATNGDNTPKFRLSNATDYASGDYGKNLVMLSEHLFGVHNPDHQDVIRSFYTSNDPRLTLTTSNVNTCYENNTGDVRHVANRYWINRTHSGTGNKNHFVKYGGNDEYMYGAGMNKIPVIRLSEMYFILFECMPAGEADGYINQYRMNRGITESMANQLKSPATRVGQLEKEYRKDFMGEGQMFFFYKKHKYTRYTWPGTFNVPAASQHYEIPKPQSQSQFE